MDIACFGTMGTAILETNASICMKMHHFAISKSIATETIVLFTIENRALFYSQDKVFFIKCQEKQKENKEREKKT